MPDLVYTPIADIRSPFKQKFAIPRQPNLVPQAEGEVVFRPGFDDPLCMRGLEQFSHVWLIFLFHETANEGWSSLVHPPRLGGRDRVGVFASRSMHRPNPVGLSVVRNLGWTMRGDSLVLRIGGLDMVDATPVLDIKPYLPYADAVPAAEGGYAADEPQIIPIIFSERAEEEVGALEEQYPHLRELISGVLAQDPRPAYRRNGDDQREYGISLYDLNIKWRVSDTLITVLRIESVPYQKKNVQNVQKAP